MNRPHHHTSEHIIEIFEPFEFLKHYKFLLSIAHECIMSRTYAMIQNLKVMHKVEGV